MGYGRRELLAGAGATLALNGLGASGAEAAEGEERGSECPFHLGTVTYNVPKDWDLPTLLKILKQVGMTGVEFRTTHAHGVEPSLSPSQRAEVRQRCLDAGMRQVSLGTVCEFQSPDPAVVRKHIED